MYRVERSGLVITLTDVMTGIKIQRTYSSPADARRAVRRLEKSHDARQRFWTRKSRS